jgi:outer membrane murein-binding lipoprotein Lpp
MKLEDREIQVTSFWGKINMVTVALACIGGFIWVGAIQAQVEQNSTNIEKLEEEVSAIESDIRSILIGIEQVKARLGIVEIER